MDGWSHNLSTSLIGQVLIKNIEARIYEMIYNFEKKIYKIFGHLNLRQFDYRADELLRGHDMDETWVANGGTVDFHG